MKNNPVELLNRQYHPSKAVRTEQDGIFNIHTFSDGTQLKVRRMFERKLFNPRWRRLKQLTRRPLWKREGVLKSVTGDVSATVHNVGNLKIVARELPQSSSGFRDRHIQAIISEILKRRVRIESPLFELQIPSKKQYFVGTRFVEGEEVEKAMSKSSPEQRLKLVHGMADTMARLHVNALSHGHMHGRNFIIRNGKLVLVDSKYLVEMPKVFSPEEVEAAALRSPSLLDPNPFFVMYAAMANIHPISFEMAIAIKDLHKNEQAEFIKRYINSYRKLYEKK